MPSVKLLPSMAETSFSPPSWLVEWIERHCTRGVIITYSPRSSTGQQIKRPVGAATDEMFSVVSPEGPIQALKWAEVMVLEVICMDAGEVFVTAQMLEYILAQLPPVKEVLTAEQLLRN